MPVRMKEESDFEGLSGTFEATAKTVADSVVEGKEDRPPALRVLFDVKGKPGESLTLFVPISPGAAERLQPFIPDVENVPMTAKPLRDFIVNNITGDTVTVYARNGTIWSRIAEEGVHRARLWRLFPFVRRDDNAPRLRLVLRTKDHREISWHVPWNVKAAKAKDPKDDDIEISLQTAAMQHLEALGLDAKRFEKDMTAAYEAGKLFARLGLDGEIPGFFGDPDDITTEILETVKTHGLKWVQVEQVDHPQFGLGPKRVGQWKMVQLAPIVVDDAGTPDPANAEFKKEAERFVQAGEMFLTQVMGTPTRFATGGVMTPDGVNLAKAVLIPLVQKHPQLTKEARPDGTPTVNTALAPEHWPVDGIVALSTVLERALAAHAAGEIDLTDPVQGAYPTEAVQGQPAEKLVEWAVANVKELAFDPEASGEAL